jgi:hypothetical protein
MNRIPYRNINAARAILIAIEWAKPARVVPALAGADDEPRPVADRSAGAYCGSDARTAWTRYVGVNGGLYVFEHQRAATVTRHAQRRPRVVYARIGYFSARHNEGRRAERRSCYRPPAGDTGAPAGIATSVAGGLPGSTTTRVPTFTRV